MWQQTCKFLGTLVPIQKVSMYLLLQYDLLGIDLNLFLEGLRGCDPLPVVTQNGAPNIHSQVEDVFKNFLLLIRVISFPAILGTYHKKLAI